jgi:flagellar biosynthesis protein FliQ
MLVGVSKIDELIVGLNFVPLLVVISVFSSVVLSVPWHGTSLSQYSCWFLLFDLLPSV